MTNHASILAGRIPRTEESGGLQSLGVTKSLTPLSYGVHMHAYEYREKVYKDIIQTINKAERPEVSLKRERRTLKCC